MQLDNEFSSNLNHTRLKKMKNLTISLGKSKRLTSLIRIIVASPQKVYLMKIFSVQERTQQAHMHLDSGQVSGWVMEDKLHCSKSSQRKFHLSNFIILQTNSS